MKVALVHFIPYAGKKNYFAFSHGLAQISASLKQDGHQTQLFWFNKNDENIESAFLNYAPDVLFVYLATNQYRLFTEALIKWNALSLPVVVGGPHATAMPAQTAGIEGVRAVCEGEGERASKAILNRLSRGAPLTQIDNVWTREGERILPPPGLSRMPNLDELPHADRSIFPYERLIHTREMDILGIEFFFARGCRYDCAYCVNSKKARTQDGCGGIRRRSVGSVVDEIERVVGTYDYRGIVGIQDDAFAANARWLTQFAEQYKSRVGLPFWCNVHADQLDEARIKALRRAGCVRVQVGVECGDETLRQTVLGKKISNRKILEGFALADKHHIKTVAYFMLGIPDETEAQIVKSIEFCRALRPHWTLVSTFCPYPGTRIYDRLVAEGRLDPHFYETLPEDTYYAPSLAYDQRGISQERLTYYYENFTKIIRSVSDARVVSTQKH